MTPLLYLSGVSLIGLSLWLGVKWMRGVQEIHQLRENIPNPWEGLGR